MHSSKEVPISLGKETGMVLAPIRMRPEHPSTALPTSARIHFGLAYGINHKIPVKSLGLIDGGSIERLISESEAHMYRNDFGSNPATLESQDFGPDEELMVSDKDVIPADMEVVKSMRNSIIGVLGPDISLSSHPRPQGSPVGCCYSLRRRNV